MIRATGSGDITISNVSNRQLAVTLQGSGDLTASGKTSDLELTMQGSGNSDLRSLAAANTKVRLYGAGNASVRAEHSFDGQVFGRGQVLLIGAPTHINRAIYGQGKILVESLQHRGKPHVQ